MEQIWRESILLDREEFMVLAALQGLEEVSGIFHETENPITEEALVQILFELHQEGLLHQVREDSEEVHTKIDEQVKTMLEGIDAAGSYVLVYERGQTGPVLCCYPGREIVLSEPSRRDENTLKLLIIAWERLLEEFADRGYLPEKETEEAQEELILPPQLVELLQAGAAEETLFQIPDVRSVIRLQKKDAAGEVRLLIWLEMGIRDVMVYWKEKTIRKFDYGKKYVRDIFRNLA